MKKIVGFSSIPLDEAVGAGADRIANLYRWLPPERYDRTIVTLTGIRSARGGAILPGGARTVPVSSPAQTLFYYLDRLRVVPFFRVAGFHRRRFPRAGRRLAERADLVQFDSPWLTPWADRLPSGTPVVYGSHNFETDWYEGEIRRYPFPRRHARFLADIERRAVLRADRVLAVTREDKENFVGRFGAAPEKIHVVPNGFDEERFRPSTPEEKREARRALGLPQEAVIALFAGSDVAPNRDAAESILRAIAPRAAAETYFVIAGSVGEAYAGAGGERVRVTGRVDDIVPWFRAADVGLNPIRLGSGSNIKLLQYLGAGLAVITTDFGMRGFDDLRGAVKIARVDRFHYHVNRVAPDPGAADAVRRRYGWRVASALLAGVYAELLGEEPAGAGPRENASAP